MTNVWFTQLRVFEKAALLNIHGSGQEMAMFFTEQAVKLGALKGKAAVQVNLYQWSVISDDRVVIPVVIRTSSGRLMLKFMFGNETPWELRGRRLRCVAVGYPVVRLVTYHPLPDASDHLDHVVSSLGSISLPVN